MNNYIANETEYEWTGTKGVCKNITGRHAISNVTTIEDRKDIVKSLRENGPIPFLVCGNYSSFINYKKTSGIISADMCDHDE